jgi:amidase/6-aminohexanoate-cyclic-dimer hydrolase
MAIDGFLTRSVRDTAALIDATHGPDLGAPYYAPPLHGTLLDAIATPPRPLRIAYSMLSFTGEPVHADCRDAIAHTADLCAQLGHELIEADPKIDILRFMRAWTNIVACGTELTVRSREHELGRRATRDDLDGVTLGAVALGETISGAEYLDAVGTVHAIGRTTARLFADELGFDALLTSTLAEPPAQLGRFRPDNDDFLDYRLGPNGVLAYSPFTALANGTGQPAMSVPLYWNGEGLPIGTHFMARAGDEAMLMQLAAQLEEADPWFARVPTMKHESAD